MIVYSELINKMDYLNKWKAEIPSCDKVVAIVLLVINIIFPGIGTAVMSCIGGFKPWTLLVAILQLLTAFIIIGWIWSIWWGIICLEKSR